MSDKSKGASPSRHIEITDNFVLKKLLSFLNKLPDKGAKMVKMGDVAIMDVILEIDTGENIFFTYYQNSIKTPDTSFYSTPLDDEKNLYEFLLKLFESGGKN